jgi:hypothetical protein
MREVTFTMTVTVHTLKHARRTSRADVEALRPARGMLLGVVAGLSFWLLIAVAILFALRLI